MNEALAEEVARLRAEVARVEREKRKLRKCLTACIEVIRTQRDELKYQLNHQNAAA